MPVNNDICNVAIVMLGIDDLTGGGGAERFFADVYCEHINKTVADVKLYFFCDENTCKSIVNVGRVLPQNRLSVFRGPDFLHLRLYWKLFRFVYREKIDIIHIPLIAPQYLPFLWLFGFMPLRFRPKLTMTQVDCGYTHKFRIKLSKLSIEERKSHILHRIYFKTVKLDGILTWYNAFERTIKSSQISGRPIIRAISYYFVDIDKFKPAGKKEKQVIWAGRFITTKRPFLFVECVRQAIVMDPEACEGWHFYLYGNGPLFDGVRECIQNFRLADRISIDTSSRMEKTFLKSAIYISTQEYENFTSLSMLEAVSCGNAIIAFDLGQTDYFVRHSVNGFLISSINPAEMAKAMLQLMKDRDLLENFSRESRNMVESHHTPENFIHELDKFFRDVQVRDTG